MSSREVTFLGTSSQVPTRQRNHNALFLRWDDLGILFDPGEGTQRQMLHAGISASQITHIAITHFHGDHCLGLAGVIQRLSLDRVAHEVTVVYPASGQVYFDRLRHASVFHDMTRLVPRPVHIPPGEAVEVCRAGRSALFARALDHGVDCQGYRLQEDDGRRMRADRLAAAEVRGPAVRILQEQGWVETPRGTVRLEDVSEPRPGQGVAVVMDTRECAGAEALAQGADLLVCEATYLQSEAAEAHDRYHMTAARAARLASGAGVRRLALTHFSQRYETLDSFRAEAGPLFSDVTLADDLSRVDVPRRAATLLKEYDKGEVRMTAAVATALLEAVRETPDDDLPRLIYADWLDDHGDGLDRARAELIRVQCDLVRRRPDDPARQALRTRERQLLRQYGAAWAGPLASVAREYQFRRGFVERARLDGYSLLRHGQRVFRATLLRHLDLVVEPGRGGELAECPLLGELASLTLVQGSGAAGDLERVLNSPHLAGLTTLRLHYTPEQAILGLASSRHLARVETLDLAYSSSVGPGMSTFLAARLPALSALYLSHCALNDQAAAQLASSPLLAGLTNLDLVGNNLGPPGALALGRSPHLGSLRSLWLSYNRVRDAGAAALAESPNLALARIYLARNDLGGGAIRALAGSPHLAGLTHLDLDYNDLDSDALLPLASAAHLHKLQALFVRCGTGVSAWARWRLRARFGDGVCQF